MGDTDLRYPQWQESLLRAVMEINPARLADRIESAQAAISLRQGQLTGISGDENTALQEGLFTLTSLKRVALTRSRGF